VYGEATLEVVVTLLSGVHIQAASNRLMQVRLP
jgi:hypothetical protein